MADIDKLVEELSGITLLEAADLVKALEEKLGVSAAAPVGVAAAGGGGGAAVKKPGEGDDDKDAETKKLRTAQFSLLIQYMNDLKGSLKEEEIEQKPSAKASKKKAKENAMDVDEEDGDLYGDLSNAKRKQG